MADAPNSGAPAAAPEAPKPKPEPVMKLVDRIELLADNSQAGSKWKVLVPPGASYEEDQLDWEYIAVARVPVFDLAKGTEKPLIVRPIVRNARWFTANKGDLPPAPPELAGPPPLSHTVKVNVDPKDPAAAGKKVTLRSDDGVYTQTKSPADDVDKRDKKTTLTFTHLLPGRRYTLLLDHGGGKIDKVFKRKVIGERKIAGPHAHLSDAIKLRADVLPEIAPGTAAKFKIFEKDKEPDDPPWKEIQGKVGDKVVEAEWKFELRKGMDDVDYGPVGKAIEKRTVRERAEGRYRHLIWLRDSWERRHGAQKKLEERAETILGRRTTVFNEAETSQKAALERKNKAEADLEAAIGKRAQLDQKRNQCWDEWQAAEKDCGQKRVEREKAEGAAADAELARMGAESAHLKSRGARENAEAHLGGRYAPLRTTEEWHARVAFERQQAEDNRGRHEGEAKRAEEKLDKWRGERERLQGETRRQAEERDKQAAAQLRAVNTYDEAGARQVRAWAARDLAASGFARAEARRQAAIPERARRDAWAGSAQKDVDAAAKALEAAQQAVQRAQAAREQSEKDRDAASEAAGKADGKVETTRTDKYRAWEIREKKASDLGAADQEVARHQSSYDGKLSVLSAKRTELAHADGALAAAKERLAAAKDDDAKLAAEDDVADCESAREKAAMERDEAQKAADAAKGTLDQANEKREQARAAHAQACGDVDRCGSAHELARSEAAIAQGRARGATDAVWRCRDREEGAKADAARTAADKREAEKRLEVARDDLEVAEEALKAAEKEANDVAAAHKKADDDFKAAEATMLEARKAQIEAASAKEQAANLLSAASVSLSLASNEEQGAGTLLHLARVALNGADKQLQGARKAEDEGAQAKQKAQKDLDDAKAALERARQDEQNAHRAEGDARKAFDDAVKKRGEAFKAHGEAEKKAGERKKELRDIDGQWYAARDAEKHAAIACHYAQKSFAGADYIYRKAAKEKEEAGAELEAQKREVERLKAQVEAAKKQVAEAEKVSEKARKEYDEAKKKLQEYEQQRAERKYTNPEYYFVVEVNGQRAKSSTVSIVDRIDKLLTDEKGAPHKETKLAFRLIDNTYREVATTGDGRFVLDPIPPGDCEVNVVGRYLFVKPEDGLKAAPVETFPEEPPPVPFWSDAVKKAKGGAGGAGAKQG